MPTRSNDYSIVSAAVAAVFAMILAACSVPYDQTGLSATLLSAQVGSVKTLVVQEPDLTRVPIQASNPPEKPVVIATAPGDDGPSIIARHCAQCHPAQLIEQTKKTSLEWESTLANMEFYGLKLDANEKAQLIDYLLAGRTE